MVDNSTLNKSPSQTIDPKTASFLTLDDISTTMRLVLAEFKNQRDEGKKWIINGTASTSLTILDLIKTEPHHAVKSYLINNDGTNIIYISHNDINDNQLWPVEKNESYIVQYKTNIIDRIYIKTLTGNSVYRLQYTW